MINAPDIDQTLYATCDEGLEEVLLAEIEAAGGKDARVGRLGVSFRGDREAVWRVNLCSRIANRVLVQLASFRGRDRDALYNGISRLPWPDLMDVDQTLAVDSSVSGLSPGPDPRFVNQVAKDAICDRFRRETGRRPSVDRKAPDLQVNVRISGDELLVSLDSSGERLHRRGYRTRAGVAPLRENLAAGILALAGWDGSAALLDPMCGSGTFVIEAALIARRIPPGTLRLRPGGPGFGFQRWPDYVPAAFQGLVAELRADILPEAAVPIVGSDIDAGLVSVARQNVSRAGVEDDVRLARRPLIDARVPAERGMLVTNPPYGARLDAAEGLEELYRALGTVLKQRFGGWTAFVLCGERGLSRHIGLKSTRKHVLSNGPIDCRLLRYELYSGSRRSE